MTFAYSPCILYLIGFGKTKGWMNVGIVFVFYSLGILSTRITMGRFVDKYGSDYAMYPAYVLGIIAVLIMNFSNYLTMLTIGITLMGMCVGAYNPEIIVFCLKRCTKYRRGTASSVFNGSSDLAFVMGSLVFGILISHFGYHNIFIISAVIMAIAFVIYFFTLSNLKKELIKCRQEN